MRRRSSWLFFLALAALVAGAPAVLNVPAK
jgi:hypothetical protein